MAKKTPAKRKPDARTFGQDLMRGEHKVGDGANKRKGQTHGRPGGNGAGRTGAEPYKGGDAWLGKEKPPSAIPGGLTHDADQEATTGTSIFDPVICEIAYRWFCPPGGKVLDPFAGGSVRGIVASRLGLAYTGIELRPEQIAANVAQLAIAGDPAPRWIEGDSSDLAGTKLLRTGEPKFDLIFSCPPYWNLEVYSEDQRDLSTMDREAFFAAQATIIKASVDRLADNRFAVWIVGDVRDADGFYINLVGRSIAAFEAAGARLYNEAILVTAVGSLPVRVGKQFTSGRKLGKTHQNVLVFCKGDWRKATQACGDVVEFGEIDAVDGDLQNHAGGYEVLPDFAD